MRGDRLGGGRWVIEWEGILIGETKCFWIGVYGLGIWWRVGMLVVKSTCSNGLTAITGYDLNFVSLLFTTG